MDDVIAQEFKGTGNMELVLDRRLADRRIFPALDIAKSGTRKEDQLLTPAELKASHVMRRRIADLTPVEGTKLIISLFEKAPSNEVLVRELGAD
jgi:transcription termination factor Rho